MTASRKQLTRYADVLAMWTSKFDTSEIAGTLALPECLVAKWIANYRDLMAAQT